MTHDLQTEIVQSETQQSEPQQEQTQTNPSESETLKTEEPFEQTLENVWNQTQKTEKENERIETKNLEEENRIENKTKEEQTEESEPAEKQNDSAEFPKTLDKALKPHWQTLPDQVKEHILKTENEHISQCAEFVQHIEQTKPYLEIIQQSGDIFDRHGVSPEQGITSLIQAQKMLDENPLQALQAIAENYGINLEQLYGAHAKTPNANPKEQNQSALSPKSQRQEMQIAQLQNQLAQRETQMQMHEERQMQARREELQHYIQDWSKDKPYFKDPKITELMGSFLSNNHCASLEDAYQKACAFFPDIQKNIQAETKKQEQIQQQIQQEKQVKTAKLAKTLNIGTKPNPKILNGKTWDDDHLLANLYDELENKLNT